MTPRGLPLLLTLAALLAVQAAELRASPQSVKQQRGEVRASKRSSHQAAIAGHAHPGPAKLHLEQQLGGWVGIAAVQASKDKEHQRDSRKHRKSHKQTQRHSSYDKRRGDADGDADEGHQMSRHEEAESMADWRAPPALESRQAADSSSSSSSSADNSGSGPGSSGSITQFTRVLKINYEGAAGSTGVVSDPAAAAATIEWSLTATSPNYDDAPKAKADGAFGHWELTVDQEVPLISVSNQPYIQFEGNASYPKRIIMHAKLSTVVEKIAPSDSISVTPSTRTTMQGEVPAAFLANVHKQLTVTACEYSGPCNWALQPNFGPLLGKLTLSPAASGSHSIQDLISRRWLPNEVVEVVCTLDEGQEQLLDCPGGARADKVPNILDLRASAVRA